MKISKTGTVLALAALAPLCALRAAAQEPAWAAMGEASGALAAIRQNNLAERTAQLNSMPMTAPDKVAAPASAPEQAWQKILEAIQTKGEYVAGDSPNPGSFGFKDIRGDEKADHSVDAVRILGELNDDKKFEARMGMFGSEKWKRVGGVWHVEQWLIATDLYGTVQEAALKEVVLAADKKTVVSIKPERLDPADPRLAAKYKSLIEFWAARP